jgi:hypothetical protein
MRLLLLVGDGARLLPSKVSPQHLMLLSCLANVVASQIVDLVARACFARPSLGKVRMGVHSLPSIRVLLMHVCVKVLRRLHLVCLFPISQNLQKRMVLGDATALVIELFMINRSPVSQSVGATREPTTKWCCVCVGL